MALLKFDYWLLEKLKKWRELSKQCPESPEELASKSLEETKLGDEILNKILELKKEDEELIVIEYLKKQLEGNFVWCGHADIDRVPSTVGTYVEQEKLKYLDDTEFFLACKRVLRYLEEKKS